MEGRGVRSSELAGCPKPRRWVDRFRLSRRRVSGEHGGHLVAVDAVTAVLSRNRPLALFSTCLLAVFLPAVGEAGGMDRPRSEVFSAADRPVVTALRSDQGVVPTVVYEVDGIERFQASLSNDRPSDSDLAKLRGSGRRYDVPLWAWPRPPNTVSTATRRSSSTGGPWSTASPPWRGR